MKKIIAILVLILTISFLYNEKTYSQTTDSIYFVADTTPDFKYTKDISKTYLDLYRKIIKYYQDKTRLKILKDKDETSAYKGLILLSCIVEKNGTLTNIQVITKGFDTDIIIIKDLLRKTGKWNPAKLRGKAVRMQIHFKLYVNLEE